MFKAIKAIFNLIFNVTTVVSEESEGIIRDSMQTIGHVARGANQLSKVEVDALIKEAKAELKEIK